MFKLQYWNARLGKWRDLVDTTFPDEAAALRSMNFASRNGISIEHLRIEFALTEG